MADLERTFFALVPRNASLDNLARLQSALAEADTEGVLRLVKRENLHLTLLFLGNLDAKRQTTAARILAEHSAPLSHPAVPSSIIPFPPGNRGRQSPRSLSLMLGGDSPEIMTLHGSLEDACKRAGFQLEQRKFRPHITLGYMRKTAQAAHKKDFIRRIVETEPRLLGELGAVSWEPPVLYGSKPAKGGSIYRSISISS